MLSIGQPTPIPTGLALAAGVSFGVRKAYPHLGGRRRGVAGGWANGDGDRLDDADKRRPPEVWRPSRGPLFPHPAGWGC